MRLFVGARKYWRRENRHQSKYAGDDDKYSLWITDKLLYIFSHNQNFAISLINFIITENMDDLESYML